MCGSEKRTGTPLDKIKHVGNLTNRVKLLSAFDSCTCARHTATRLDWGQCFLCTELRESNPSTTSNMRWSFLVLYIRRLY